MRWPHPFRPTHLTHDERERFVIVPHHPDRLRRPAASVGAGPNERFQQALVWNVFRTLELLTPSFWLRRFHVRLTGEPSLVPSQIARVRLWKRLPLPPIQRIDGERPDVLAEVVIETEHVVWTLVSASALNDLVDDQASAIADAGAWFAGARHHYCGVIASSDTTASLASALGTRYARSRESARLRSATRGPATPTHVHWGAIGWPSLASLLHGCDAASLPAIERALARHALEWLARVGIDPDADDAA